MNHKKYFTFKEACRAFAMHPSQIYQLECAQKLPELGHNDFEFLEALAKWHLDKRGKLPREATELLERIRQEVSDDRQ